MHRPCCAGEEIINAVGAEVDRIETEIQRINPGVRYVDLETDRGQVAGTPALCRAVCQQFHRILLPGSCLAGHRLLSLGLVLLSYVVS